MSFWRGLRMWRPLRGRTLLYKNIWSMFNANMLHIVLVEHLAGKHSSESALACAQDARPPSKPQTIHCTWFWPCSPPCQHVDPPFGICAGNHGTLGMSRSVDCRLQCYSRLACCAVVAGPVGHLAAVKHDVVGAILHVLTHASRHEVCRHGNMMS